MYLIKTCGWFKATRDEWLECAEHLEHAHQTKLAATILNAVERQTRRDPAGSTREIGLRLQDGSVDKVRSYIERYDP
jgi:hypothetical protein